MKAVQLPGLKSILILILFLTYSLNLFCGDDRNTFTVLNSIQTVSFEIKDGQLISKLTVSETIQCNNKTGELFKKIIYFDDQTKLDKITINGRLRKYIESNDIPNEGIFHNDTKFAYIDFSFSTNIKKPMELEYTKIFQDYKFIEILNFENYHYAINHSEINIEIPDWLKCDIKEFNFDSLGIIKVTKSADGMKIYSFTRKNVEAAKELKSRPDFRKYMPHIMLLPKYMTVNGKQIELMPTVNHLYKWYYSLATQIGNNVEIVKSKALELTQGLTNDEDKIKAIFYYIQDNIKYIAFEAGIMGFKPESCQNVYEKKYGDCKGMANLAKTMLTSLGFDARLTWLGTNDIPYNYDYPSLYVDNHMICTVLLNGKQIFIDPTETESDLYYYSDRIQGREVMIENGTSFIKSAIPHQDDKLHGFNQSMNLRITDGTIYGEACEEMKGNYKTRFSNYINAVSSKNKQEFLQYYLSQDDNNILVSSLQDNIHPQRDKDFKLCYNLNANNQVLNLGKEKYINLEFEKPLKSIQIEEGRNCSYRLDKKINSEYTTVFSIPANHKVTYTPQYIESITDDWHIKMSYTIDNDKILYKKSIHFKTSEIKKNKLSEWKAFSGKLKEFYEDRIIIEEK